MEELSATHGEESLTPLRAEISRWADGVTAREREEFTGLRFPVYATAENTEVLNVEHD